MKITYLSICLGAFLLGSCNDNDVFEQEQYKHVFSFISDANHISQKIFNLSDTARTGYIALSMGGSNATDKDVTVHIVIAPDILEQYNISQFEYAVDKYARELPVTRYTMATSNCIIKKGKEKGVIPIMVIPEGLSPDSTYFLPLRIDSYDHYEVNPERNYLLYQVQIENTWAQASNNGSQYTMAAMRYDSGATTGISIPGTKSLYPIAAHTVRTMAGNESFDSNLAELDNYAIYLDIAADGKVTIRPYKDIQIVQLDDDSDYPNRYTLDKTDYNAYHNFALHYKYKAGKVWYEIKEELRMMAKENK